MDFHFVEVVRGIEARKFPFRYADNWEAGDELEDKYFEKRVIPELKAKKRFKSDLRTWKTL